MHHQISVRSGKCHVIKNEQPLPQLELATLLHVHKTYHISRLIFDTTVAILISIVLQIETYVQKGV